MVTGWLLSGSTPSAPRAAVERVGLAVATLMPSGLV